MIVNDVDELKRRVTLCAALLMSSLSFAQAPQYGAVGNLYRETCASCHGEALEGSALGVPLLGTDLMRGSSIDELRKSIGEGNVLKGMPEWGAILKEEQILSLAIYIVEQRSGYNYNTYNVREKFQIPEGVQSTKLHDFKLEVFVDGLDPLPYSIESLPDGRLLLSEKKRGLRIISKDGEPSALIVGTPRVFGDSEMNNDNRALDRGMGWLQDVAPHPDYAKNGWIYVYHGDRCEDCNVISRAEERPVSMSRLVRGRIRDGEWVDEQTIWTTGFENYTGITDIALGGRIAFDDQGYVYFSVGAKSGFYDLAIQDLSKPWGKIHRVFDDGRIPSDNPFVDVENAVQSIWTLGHRVPQGLKYDAQTGNLWSTEHGARGGDEVNLLVGGRNYGWPLTTTGVDYDGSSIEDKFDVKFDLADFEQPVVDLTPSPAVSNLVIYHGDQFPDWEGNLIVGSLKANTLFRFAIRNNKLVEQELLVKGVGRIRDIEVSVSGDIFLLTENASGGAILRMSPVSR